MPEHCMDEKKTHKPHLWDVVLCVLCEVARRFKAQCKDSRPPSYLD